MQIIFYFYLWIYWVKAQALSRLFGKLGETEREDSKVRAKPSEPWPHHGVTSWFHLFSYTSNRWQRNELTISSLSPEHAQSSDNVSCLDVHLFYPVFSQSPRTTAEDVGVSPCMVWVQQKGFPLLLQVCVCASVQPQLFFAPVFGAKSLQRRQVSHATYESSVV